MRRYGYERELTFYLRRRISRFMRSTPGALLVREVRTMANVVRSAGVKFNLDTLTDTELDTIISNTEAQQAQMERFMASLVREKVRRQPASATLF